MSSTHPRAWPLLARWLSLLTIVSLVGVAIWLSKSFLGSPGTEVPLPDLTVAHVNVATAVNQGFEHVRQAPQSAEAWGTYGEVLMVHEWNAEALQCFEEAAKLDPTQIRWPYLAGVLFERRDPAIAVEKYEAAQVLDPSYAPLFVRLGTALQRLNRNSEAEIAFRKAAELSPTEPQPLIGLARLATANNAWKQAVELLEQAAKLAPTNREALVELTRARLVLGTTQSLNRETQTALMSGEKYQSMSDPILQSINGRETASRLAASQADALAAEGDPQKAAEAFIALIKKRPDLARPRINLASLYLSQGQIPLAMVTLRELIHLFPEDPMGHLLLSYALEAQQSSTEARVELEEAIRLKPDYADAHFALGMANERDGNLDKAIAAYRLATQTNGRHVQARLALGLALKKQGKLDEAIQEMTAAVRLSPGDRVSQSYLEKTLAERNAAHDVNAAQRHSR